MGDKDLTTLLEARASEFGTDLFGVASIDSFQYAPEEHHPSRFLSEARSVIVVGVRVLRGLTLVQKNQTAYLPFDLFGHGWLSNVPINLVALHVARLVEDSGYYAVPLPWPCEDSWLQKQIDKNVSGKIMEVGWPGETYIAFKHCAVAAGLGEFGWNRLLLTPQYGPRQRLAVVVTNAPLEPSPLLNGRLCDPEDCGYRCVKACPVNTLEKEQHVTIRIGERQYRYACFNELKCSWVISGLYRDTCKFAPFEVDVPENLTPELLVAYKKMFKDFTPAYAKYKTFAFTASTFCSRCLIACCEYLEEKGKIGNAFIGNKDEKQ